jgi:hypothetical protein
MRELCRLGSILVLLFCGCGDPDGAGEEGGFGDDSVHSVDLALSVKSASSSYCSTSVVRKLSQQLIEEMICLKPGVMKRIDGIKNVYVGSVVNPYLQTGAANALARAAARRAHNTVYVSSALRTLPQQYLLRRWYLQGRCGIYLAARPSKSNHESGLAVDVGNYSTWRSSLTSEGFVWSYGYSDPVHFDYPYGADLRYFSVLAFQRLWNRNYPWDRIGEDGHYGSQTETRLARSPVGGFATGASCGTGPTTTKPTSLEAIEVHWHRESDGHYELRALASKKVTAVRYYVDGFWLSPPGTVTRAKGHNFPASYRFSVAKSERRFEVRGYDSAGKQIARGVGLLDVTPGTAVYIKQMGASLYEVGLERPSAAVAALEVRADGYLLTDSVTGATRVKAPRFAVRSKFFTLGTRKFKITTFGANNSVRGHLHRIFTLR